MIVEPSRFSCAEEPNATKSTFLQHNNMLNYNTSCLIGRSIKQDSVIPWACPVGHWHTRDPDLKKHRRNDIIGFFPQLTII